MRKKVVTLKCLKDSRNFIKEAKRKERVLSSQMIRKALKKMMTKRNKMRKT